MLWINSYLFGLFLFSSKHILAYLIIWNISNKISPTHRHIQIFSIFFVLCFLCYSLILDMECAWHSNFEFFFARKNVRKSKRESPYFPIHIRVSKSFESKMSEVKGNYWTANYVKKCKKSFIKSSSVFSEQKYFAHYPENRNNNTVFLIK